MNTAQRGLLAASLAFVCATFSGCSNVSSGVSLLDTKIQEWKSPIDGRTYMLAVPTWSVIGNEPVAEVWATAVATGPKGEWTPEGPKKPLYRGDALDPGTTFHPTNLPEDAVTLGILEEVLSKTGPNPKVEVSLWASSTKSPEEEANKQDPP